jgi:hypothetical protein
MLALVPATIVGRGFMKSANIPNAVRRAGYPIPVKDNLTEESMLVDGWHLYESCGQPMFQLYGASGDICAPLVAYLVRKKPVQRNYAALPFNDRINLGRVSGTYWEYEWECIPLEFNDLDCIAVDDSEEEVRKLINWKIAYAIKYRKPQPFNMNGGEFPTVTPDERADEYGLLQKEINRHLTGVYPALYGHEST